MNIITFLYKKSVTDGYYIERHNERQMVFINEEKV